MEQDTPNRGRRAPKPPAALFVAPAEDSDPAAEVPHQAKPASSKPPTGAPFATPPQVRTSPKNPETPSTTKRPDRRAIPGQLTFMMPEAVQPAPAPSPQAGRQAPGPSSGEQSAFEIDSTSDANAGRPGHRVASKSTGSAEAPQSGAGKAGPPEPEAEDATSRKAAPAQSAKARRKTVPPQETTRRQETAPAQEAELTQATGTSRKAAPARKATKATTAKKAATEKSAPVKQTPPAEAAGSTPSERPAAKQPAPAKRAPAKGPVVRTPPLSRTASEPSEATEPNGPENAGPGSTSAQVTPTARKRPARKVPAPAGTPASAGTRKAAPTPQKIDTPQATRAPEAGPEKTGTPEPTRPPADTRATSANIAHPPIPQATDIPSDSDLVRTIRTRPHLTSAALALAAVARFGGPAGEQAEWLRRTYPDVPAERLAQVALRTARRRTRLAVGSTLIGGPLGVVAGMSALAWAHTRLVIDLAAVFGSDPSDPARAADVLVLLGAYPDMDSALHAVRELTGVGGLSAHPVSGARSSILVSTTAQFLTRTANRLLPGTGAVIQAVSGANSTERLSDRTIRHFHDPRDRRRHH